MEASSELALCCEIGYSAIRSFRTNPSKNRAVVPRKGTYLGPEHGASFLVVVGDDAFHFAPKDLRALVYPCPKDGQWS